MKAKVFKYKFDGNTVVAPYMELEPYAENVYLSLAEKNKYGYENDDYYHVVCKIGNVYFSCGQYLRRILDMEGHREEAAGYCRNWISNTLQNAANGNHVSLLSVFLKNSDLTRLPCCKPVRRTGKNRSRGNWSKKKKKRNNAS